MTIPEIIYADADDAKAAVQDALSHIDMTADELIAAYRANDFPTLHARLAWVAVGDILLTELVASENIRKED